MSLHLIIIKNIDSILFFYSTSNNLILIYMYIYAIYKNKSTLTITKIFQSICSPINLAYLMRFYLNIFIFNFFFNKLVYSLTVSVILII